MRRDRIKTPGRPKPSHGSYFSREEGVVVKDWGGRLPVALIYPNSYYLGMSNLGLHALYNLLNSHDFVVCERVFWQKENQGKKTAILSLESHRPLSDFAVLAFSISYELDYFNVVSILQSSGIPLSAVERDERHPVVIAGGPCVIANPIPLSPFFDCLCIGEAEPILPAILPILSEGIGGKRQELIQTLASLPGVYVPRHSTTPVVRQWAKNLDDFPVNSTILTTNTELGNLYLIEVERGCNWGCRFCLVSTAFSPMRFRSVDTLLEQAGWGLKYRKRIGLVGPAVLNHPELEQLLVELNNMGAGFSISSLRASNLSDKLIKEIIKGGAKTITLAPEAGSQRLRQVIKKGVSEDDILSATDRLVRQGIRQLKLYFMIGLPSETEEDIEEIINLSLKCKKTIDRYQSGTRLTLNIAPFVPKAGTPFQRASMAPLSTLTRHLSTLKSKLATKGIKVKSESPAWSQIQGVLARGDSGVAEVLANMKDVSLSGWRQAVKKCHLDANFYAHQRWNDEQKLPWSVIDSGTKPAYFEAELNKALS